ncbi:flagellar protein FlgN [Virgibacillus sp. MSJ-26]|uniref:DUF6792 domain-containing protein n=1 Tax=Virgibacillus sp. MSJ-26 TaxID=2841522 RepID=UPI001C0F85D9|nr:DUF6792 domain-containing protein [Virgibacillus sp. MSJ-26]MBU5465515.1 flagellar protein FlgN [Virgibacillus sp. MSJ-26]
MSENVFQNRLMQEEYSGLTEKEIRQIYIEETGKQPPESIDIYYSEDYVDKIDSYGFNGTIIHLYDEEQDINQMYTITRGSEASEIDNWRPEDWAYNLMGIFVGQNSDQYEAAKLFDNKVTRIIENKYDDAKNNLNKIGLGHSLGGNLITLIQLTDDIYDDVFTTNAAPPTTFQLANIDVDFLENLSKEYNIDFMNNFNAIYNLNPTELEAFAEEYYKEAGENINHLVMDQDFLNALSVVRGFIEVGNFQRMDAYADQDVRSLDDLFAELPDGVIKDIQIFFAENYSDIYNSDGFDGLLQSLTGINPDIIDLMTGTETDKEYKFYEVGYDFVKMINDSIKKVPVALEHIKNLYTQARPIINSLVDLGYLDKNEGKLILSELESLENDLTELKDLLNAAKGSQLLPTVFKPSYLIYANRIKELFASIGDRFNNLSEYTEDIFDLILKNVDAHSLKVVIKALASDLNKSYESGNVYVHVVIDGEEIKVNLSSLTKVYLEGLTVLESKEFYLSLLKNSYEHEYLDDFPTRKNKIVDKMDDMEANPSHYQQHFLGSFTYDTEAYYRLTKINVHDDFPVFPDDSFTAVFDNMFNFIESEISKMRDLLQSIMDGIESLFDKDQELADTNFTLEGM